MSNLLWTHGYIAWPLFATLVFSAALLLATDIVWRLLEMRFKNLLAITVLIWAISIAAIFTL